jgi:hypothetical protein
MDIIGKYLEDREWTIKAASEINNILKKFKAAAPDFSERHDV